MSGSRLLIVLLILTAAPLWAQTEERGVTARRLQDLPLLFEQNRGQASSDVRYLTRGAGSSVLLRQRGFVWVVHPQDPAGARTAPQIVNLELVGANPDADVTGERPSRSNVSYLRGSDPAGWLKRVPTFRQVRYPEAYPGVDLVFYGRGRDLEYDFVVAPGADPAQIRWKVSGAQAEIDADGGLRLSTPAGVLQHLKPRLYQEDGDQRTEVAGRYRRIEEDVFGFEVDGYDSDVALTIDPVLVYSTFLGGTRGDVPGGIAFDSDGNAYVAGITGSLDFPLANPFQDTFAGGGTPNGDIFVTKIDKSGEFVVYSTYVGGEGTDVGRGIAVDAQGRAAVTGTTFSDDFPFTPGAFQTDCSGLCPFVFRLDAEGDDLSYSTFIGRGDGMGIGVDAAHQVTITGRTSSTTFPVANAFQAARAGGFDAFVSKLNAAGSALVFSTYFGGSGDENLSGKMDVAIDGDGNIHIVGRTTSTDLPVQNAVQAASGGDDDAFVAKFTPQGGLAWSTYVGGSEDEDGRGIALDQNGNVFIVGNTESADFPVSAAFQPAFGGGVPFGDAFLSKILADGSGFVFSTFLGGSAGDTANDVTVDELGRAVVVGNGSSNFPVAHSLRPFNGIDNYVAKFSQDGSELFYSTPIGGGDQDVFVSSFGTDVVVAGNIAAGNYPILNAFQPVSFGDFEVFLTHLADMGTLNFAQFANGGSPGARIISDLLLTGSSTVNAANATAMFRKTDGTPAELNLTVTDGDGNETVHDQVSEVQVQVPPLGLVKITTDGEGDVVSGTVTVEFDAPIGGVVRFTLDPLGTTGVGESKLVRGFVSPVRRTAINTGVAIQNATDGQISLTMRLRDRNGQEVQGGLRVEVLAANAQRLGFINELFPNVPENILTDFEGTITVEVTSQNGLIGATALELGDNPGEFTTLSVTPVP